MGFRTGLEGRLRVMCWSTPQRNTGERAGGGQGTDGGPMRAPTMEAMGTKTDLRHPIRGFSHLMRLATIWRTHQLALSTGSLVKNGYLFGRAVEKVPELAVCPEKPKDGVRTENNFHINITREERDASTVRFSKKRHALLSKTFLEHRCKLKE